MIITFHWWHGIIIIVLIFAREISLYWRIKMAETICENLKDNVYPKIEEINKKINEMQYSELLDYLGIEHKIESSFKKKL